MAKYAMLAMTDEGVEGEGKRVPGEEKRKGFIRGNSVPLILVKHFPPVVF